MSVEQIREEALKLPAEDREWLAQELWNSIPEESDPELKATLDRRWEEIVTGKVETIPLEDTLQGIEKRLAEKRETGKITSRSR